MHLSVVFILIALTGYKPDLPANVTTLGMFTDRSVCEQAAKAMGDAVSTRNKAAGPVVSFACVSSDWQKQLSKPQ